MNPLKISERELLAALDKKIKSRTASTRDFVDAIRLRSRLVESEPVCRVALFAV